MDGGVQQEEMGVQTKQEVKERAVKHYAALRSCESVSPVITVRQESANGKLEDLEIAAHNSEVIDEVTFIISERHRDGGGGAPGPAFSEREDHYTRQQRRRISALFLGGALARRRTVKHCGAIDVDINVSPTRDYVG